MMGDMDQEFWNDAYKEDPTQVVVADHFLDKEIGNLRPGVALDLGCGSGPNAIMLAERGWSVVGVDWAEHAVELATKSAQEKGLNASFYVGDITNWEPPKEFDLVISTYALPGGDGSKQTLQTAIKALAPGGTLLVIEWDKSMAKLWHFDEEDLLSPEEIANLLPGLEIKKAEVQRLENAFPTDDDPRGHAGSAANVAIVRARKPKGL